MAERIKAAIKSPEILELVNICVINALGYKSKISSKTVDNAIDSIVSFVHSEIDSSNLSDNIIQAVEYWQVIGGQIRIR